jgi:hypothetical protein
MARKRMKDDELPSIQSRGGIARRKALSAEVRREIASKAAEARWGTAVPKATHTGTLRIGDVEIPCAVLDDGRRVLTQQGFLRAIGRNPNPQAGTGAAGMVEGLPAFLMSESLKRFISEDLRRSSTPIIFKPLGTGGYKGRAFGHLAELLPSVCSVYLEARRQNALPRQQRHIAEQCELVLQGLAHVGITALVDEATGYQELRDKVALQAILDQFLRKEFAAWAKCFPDEFYQHIFRLRGWTWKGMKVNRPQIVANYTKDIVYARLAPRILTELETRNPIERGQRKAKHHQWLTEDVGHPALAQHLYAVIGLMRVSDSWNQFKQILDLAYPKRNDTLQLPLFKDDVSSEPQPPSSQ